LKIRQSFQYIAALITDQGWRMGPGLPPEKANADGHSGCFPPNSNGFFTILHPAAYGQIQSQGEIRP
jgi:hypothetical protein